MQKKQLNYKLYPKTQDSCNYHGRPLKFYQQKCAYHPMQIITNFCKCNECLLPVCSTCIKLHSDQHKLNKSAPHFQEITKVLEQILNTYSRLDEYVESVKKMLVNTEHTKKENEDEIRKRLIEHRNRLVKQFQKQVMEMENKIVNQIIKEDKWFIEQIQKIDDELNTIVKSIKQDRQKVQSQEILKHIIIYYGNKSCNLYEGQIHGLKEKGQGLVKKNIVATVDDKELANLSKAVRAYMKIQISQ